ncbi:hypothetical protein AgCh_003662 [Apium graveolens]
MTLHFTFLITAVNFEAFDKKNSSLDVLILEDIGLPMIQFLRELNIVQTAVIEADNGHPGSNNVHYDTVSSTSRSSTRKMIDSHATGIRIVPVIQLLRELNIVPTAGQRSITSIAYKMQSRGKQFDLESCRYDSDALAMQDLSFLLLNGCSFNRPITGLRLKGTYIEVFYWLRAVSEEELLFMQYHWKNESPR